MQIDITNGINKVCYITHTNNSKKLPFSCDVLLGPRNKQNNNLYNYITKALYIVGDIFIKVIQKQICELLYDQVIK